MATAICKWQRIVNERGTVGLLSTVNQKWKCNKYELGKL